MCGIVGYIGSRSTVNVLVEGLRKLEYRGYDSAGIAIVSGGTLERRRAQGKIGNLEAKLRAEPVGSGYGIGHTRWATHGRPSEENAHPHVDCTGKLVVVHNGIIENYLALKKELLAAGHTLVTETDTEVVAHLIEAELAKTGPLGLEKITAETLLKAFRAVIARLQGIFALGVLHSDVKDTLLATRMGPPLVVAYGEGEFFLASDIPAVLAHTRSFTHLEDGDVALLTASGISLYDAAGRPLQRPPLRIDWDPVQAEKAGYRHFMLKEIHEQPRAIKDTLVGRLSADGVNLSELEITDAEVKTLTRVQILACGTSLHAGWVGKFLFENLAGLPTECDYGSEFRYRSPVVPPGTLALAISQSGETADTLAAIKEAKRLGALPIAICNVVGSAITREARATLQTHAGPEIGVASTKAFTTQLIALTLLAADLGVRRGVLSPAALRELYTELVTLPHKVETALKLTDAVAKLARQFHNRTSFLFLGRGVNYPTALEGALKLKEISYIHAEGYPAGEMKHGPIALIDDGFPVVAICLKDKVHEKMLGNVEEVKARDGAVIALVTEGDDSLKGKADAVLPLPAVHPLLSPLIAIIPLQLLAYEIAVLRGCDVDQPRNLAKSVTVE